MKQFKLFILTFLVAGFSLSQNVGINTTGAAPDAGAGLDINFTNKGLLIPRVNIANLNTIAPITGSATTSLLVYNTNGTTGTGYHYWNGAQWVRLALSNEAWQVDGNAGLNAANNFLGTTDNIALRIRTNNAERFEFATDGRLRSFSSGSAGTPTYSWTGDTDIGMYRAGANRLAFSTGGNERMRIDQNGVVGIGTTTPSTSIIGGVNVLGLNVTSGATPAGAGMSEFINTSTTGTALGVSNTQATNVAAALEGTTSGTGSAVRGLHLPGFGNGIGLLGSSNSGNGFGILGTNPGGNWAIFGNGFSGGTTNWFNISDKMFKTNIAPLENALAIINSLNPKSYEMNTEDFPTLNFNGGQNFGFIAQEVQEILPTLVKSSSINLGDYSERGVVKNNKSVNALAMDYVSLIPILTKAIQEQQEQIESYEDRISTLESQLQELLEKQ